jgi:hypothetical protein
MYVWPCILYNKDDKYQLDATTVVYYHKLSQTVLLLEYKLYSLRSTICAPEDGHIDARNM